MGIMRNATEIRLGTAPAKRVYMGDIAVWQPLGYGITVNFVADDALQSMASVHIHNFRQWLGIRKGFLGETGVPRNRLGSEQASWNALLEVILRRCAADGIAWTGWASGHSWGSTYDLSSYLPETDQPGGKWLPTATTAVYEDRYSDDVPFTGMNYAGFEFDTTTLPPSGSDIRFHYGRGGRVMRFQLAPERLYPTAGGQLDVASTGYVVQLLDRAAEVGMKIILDIHHPLSGDNYGKMFGVPVTDSASLAYYKDYVSKLLTVIGNKPALWGLDIMNEPAAVGHYDWEGVSQKIYSWLRGSIGWQGYVMIPIASYSGLHSVQEFHPNGPWIVEVPNEDKLFYEGHYYPNRVGQFGHYDGTYNKTGSLEDCTYQENVADATEWQGQGAFSYTPRGDTIPPTVPGQVALVAATPATMTLSWGSSTDNIAIGGYLVYVNGAPAFDTRSTATSCKLVGLLPATNFSLSVSAYDTSGNLSAASSSITLMTAAVPVAGAAPVFEELTATETMYASNYIFRHSAFGANRYVVVGISHLKDSIVDVTYGGLPMTKLGGYLNQNVVGVTLYGLVAPPEGIQDIVVRHTEYVLTSIYAVSYVGVDQSAPLDGVFGLDAYGDDAHGDVTTGNANSLVCSFVAYKTDVQLTSSSGILRNTMSHPDQYFGTFAVSEQLQAAPGIASVVWSSSTSDNYVLAGVALRRAA